MNIQGAKLLSMLSGSESVGNIQQGSPSGAGDQAGFASALMEQLGLLQSADSPDMAALQSLMQGTSAEGGLQNFAALFGNNLPAANKTSPDINLEDTLQTLADVMQQLQQLDAEASSLQSPVVSTETPKAVSTDLQQEALDGAALANNPLFMPISVPADITNVTEPVSSDSSELTGMLGDIKKPTALLGSDAKNQNGISNVVAKPDELGVEFDRSISAIMAKEDTSGNPQQDKSTLGLKAEPSLNQLDAAANSPEGNTSPSGVAGDIARMSNAIGQSPATIPAANQPSMQKPLGDSAWQQELGDKLIWMHKQDMPSVQLRLNPEHLGPVFIKIDVSQDQATVAFTAQHLAVKEAIEAAIPKLREMLGGQQLNLVDVNVSQQQSDQKQSSREFFQMAGDQSQRRDANGELLANGAVNDSQDIVDEIEAGRAIATNGLLSLFA